MGCDIHAIIEYKRYDFDLPFDCFGKGDIYIPRDFALFSALALGEGGLTDNLLYQVRGLPNDCSSEVRNSFFVDADEIKQILAIGDDEFLWEDESLEEYVDEYGECVREEYATKNRLPNFDFYGASWLNVDELNEVLVHGKIEMAKLSAEFRAVISVLHILSKQFGVENVRLVFWFDGAD